MQIKEAELWRVAGLGHKLCPTFGKELILASFIIWRLIFLYDKFLWVNVNVRLLKIAAETNMGEDQNVTIW